MELSVNEAARLLGKSPRTVRHLVATGQLRGRREGVRWLIDREALESISPAEAASRRAQVERVRERVDAAMDRAAPPPADGRVRRAYSVRDLRAFELARELIAKVARARDASSGPAGDRLARAEGSLRECLRALADGCHQFHAHAKADCYAHARSTACAAVADLLAFTAVHEQAEADEVAERIEAELLRSIRGLIRSAEKARR